MVEYIAARREKFIHYLDLASWVGVGLVLGMIFAMVISRVVFA